MGRLAPRHPDGMEHEVSKAVTDAGHLAMVDDYIADTWCVDATQIEFGLFLHSMKAAATEPLYDEYRRASLAYGMAKAGQKRGPYNAMRRAQKLWVEETRAWDCFRRTRFPSGCAYRAAVALLDSDQGVGLWPHECKAGWRYRAPSSAYPETRPVATPYETTPMFLCKHRDGSCSARFSDVAFVCLRCGSRSSESLLHSETSRAIVRARVCRSCCKEIGAAKYGGWSASRMPGAAK